MYTSQNRGANSANLFIGHFPEYKGNLHPTLNYNFGHVFS